MDINKKATKMANTEVKFMRPDGTMTEYAVGHIINSTTGEIMFFELLGTSKLEGIPTLKIKGQEKYKRIIIRRCFPVIDNDIQGFSKKNILDLLKLKEKGE